jgi:predicted RND superfamily exporter protein
MGTGGALFGSMVTTVFGIGSLTLSITPLLGQFGIIIAIGVLYSFIFSIMMIPSLFKIYHEGLIP